MLTCSSARRTQIRSAVPCPTVPNLAGSQRRIARYNKCPALCGGVDSCFGAAPLSHLGTSEDSVSRLLKKTSEARRAKIDERRRTIVVR